MSNQGKAMYKEEVLNLVCNMLDEEKRKKVLVETNFFDEAIFDSFGLIQLVNSIEEFYGISIRTEDLNNQNFLSVSEISKLVSKYKDEK